jgi:hypothetical protein
LKPQYCQKKKKKNTQTKNSIREELLKNATKALIVNVELRILGTSLIQVVETIQHKAISLQMSMI